MTLIGMDEYIINKLNVTTVLKGNKVNNSVIEMVRKTAIKKKRILSVLSIQIT